LKKKSKYTCKVCVDASEYCRIDTGVMIDSVFVADDCCRSLFGDGGNVTGGGISMGIEGKRERAGDRFDTYTKRRALEMIIRIDTLDGNVIGSP
jgi:hypothetical protein